MEVSKPTFFGEVTLKLLPLLALYIGYVMTHQLPHLRGDEFRYMANVQNILHGFFASEETLMFWNGPGYPLYIAPFVALKLPLLVPRLGNSFFLFFAVLYFHASLKLMAVEKRTLAYAYGFGVLMLFHGAVMDMLFTESMCAFLICGSLYHFIKSVHCDHRCVLNLCLSGLMLAYLAWTKVFFGYVLEAAFLIALVTWILFYLFKNFQTDRIELRSTLQRVMALTGIALALCLPYLAYTYKITGKLHYWGNSGGVMLYCLSVPEKELVGDWLNFDTVRGSPEFFKHETDVFLEMAKLDYIARDSAFKKLAMENIKAHPKKFFWNWRANVNRLVFGFPVSPYPGSDLELKTGNRSFFYALPILLFFFALIPGWLSRKAIPIEAHLVLFFALISLGGLSLLSGIPRQVFPILPILMFWTVLVFEKGVVISQPQLLHFQND